MSELVRLKRAVIREEIVALTGDYTAAIILNQFIYWSERTRDFDQFIIEENKRIEKFLIDGKDIDKTNGWIYKTAKELINECMLMNRTKVRKKEEYQSKSIQESTCLEYIDYLVSSGWLEQRKNPKFGYDRTYQYRVDLVKIFNQLLDLGYILQDYKISTSFIPQLRKLKLQSLKNEEGILLVENVDKASESEEATSKIQIQTSENEDYTSKVEIETPKNEEQYHRLHTNTTFNITSEQREKEIQSSYNILTDHINTILEVIRNNDSVSDVSFNTWIKETVGKAFIDNGFIIIPCLNNFTKEILEMKYSDLIRIHFKSIDSLKKFELRFDVLEGKYQAS